MPNKPQSHSIFSIPDLLFFECSSNLKWSVAYGKAIQFVLVETHLCQNLKEHENVGWTHIKPLIMSLSPLFQLWALVKTPAVCNLERMHILSRLRNMCVVFTTPCRLDGPRSFHFSAVHYLEFWQSLFSSLSKDGSSFPHGVSVNMELLARAWLAGAVCAFTMFCFLKYSFNKTVWWEDSEVDLCVWQHLISAEAHWVGIHNPLRCGWWLRSRHMPDGTPAFLACASEFNIEVIKSAYRNNTGSIELQSSVLKD